MAQNQRNWRHPIHVGTRAWTDSEYGGKGIIAAPVLPGEQLSSVRLDAVAMTRDSDPNMDQPPIIQWWGGFFPFTWAGTESINTADIDEMVDEIDETTGGGVHLGGEADIGGGGQSDYLGDGGLFESRIFLDRTRIGRSISVGKDALENDDARHSDEFHTNFRLNWRFNCMGVIILGGKQYNVAANTVFAVGDMDEGIQSNNLIAAYTEPTEGGGTHGNVRELLYGGDNYIEADSYKSDAIRMHMIAKFHIRKNSRIGV